MSAKTDIPKTEERTAYRRGEAADIIGCCGEQVAKMLEPEDGRLEVAYVIGGERWITRESVERQAVEFPALKKARAKAAAEKRKQRAKAKARREGRQK